METEAKKRHENLRNLVEGLEQRKIVLAELQTESEIRSEKLNAVKESSRKIDLGLVDIEFSRKKANREWENISDSTMNQRRENIRRAEMVQSAQNDTLDLETKKRKILAELSKAQEFNQEVDPLLLAGQ